MDQPIFTYGALMRDGRFGHYLRDCETYRLDGEVQGWLLPERDDFPFKAAVISPGILVDRPALSLRGELVWVRPAALRGALRWLDQVEGVEHGLYDRITVPVWIAPGSVVQAHAWIAGPLLRLPAYQ